MTFGHLDDFRLASGLRCHNDDKMCGGQCVKWMSWTRLVAAVASGFAFGLATPSAHAGFLQAEGTYQLISTNSISRFSRSFDARGSLKRSAVFSKTSLDIHLSYGFSETLTFISELSSERLLPQIIGDPGAASPWSAMAGPRLQLWRDGPTIVSVQVLAGAGQAIGTSGFAGDVRLLAAHSFAISGQPAFVDAQIGYRQGAPGARSEIRLDGTFGVKPHDNWLLLAQVFAARAMAAQGQPHSLRIKAQISAVWHVGETWSIQTAAFTTFAGINAAQESGLSLGLWRKF